ncbi:PRA1 family protein 2 [Epinephelus fuscoguttatus]|uniref:PRA1 family protein 2 n=2 Tax=Epinephelus lanceolatus TaxID=310571 RepID=UPI001445F57B|nr:PRA1 family protein 2 [Epinephelus lanceolatus]XP_049417228.1 PRA1 family protein 2 [Epinephelus fuscoguttatus]XP_049924210.1 PRA1 family protein 2 [Epinephelus moara]
MAAVQPPPLRSLEDFLLSSARFAVPDVRDLDRWNNRIINNLLYYQSNYLLSAVGILLIVGYFQPFQLCLGAMVVTVLFLGFVWVAENQAPVRRFRRNHPSISVFAILSASYLFISVLGSVAVFLFGIAFPVLLVLVHASVRLRSLKNKLENKLESIGLKRTPMGLLLEALGQEQEAGS